MKYQQEELPDRIAAKESDYLFCKQSNIEGAGIGLYTSIQIYKNEVIALFKGEVLLELEAAKRAKGKLDGYFINMLDGTILDSKNTACYAKYANDAKGVFKTKYKNNAIISLDGDEAVCLVATRNIKVGEEIFCGYGDKYWSNYKVLKL